MPDDKGTTENALTIKWTPTYRSIYLQTIHFLSSARDGTYSRLSAPCLWKNHGKYEIKSRFFLPKTRRKMNIASRLKIIFTHLLLTNSVNNHKVLRININKTICAINELVGWIWESRWDRLCKASCNFLTPPLFTSGQRLLTSLRMRKVQHPPWKPGWIQSQDGHEQCMVRPWAMVRAFKKSYLQVIAR